MVRVHLDDPLLAEALAGPLASVEEIVFGISGGFQRNWDAISTKYRDRPLEMKGLDCAS